MPTNWRGAGKRPRHYNSTQSRRRRHFQPFYELREMPIGSKWWRHIRCGRWLGRHGCPCSMWRVWVKQWPKYLTLCRPDPFLHITFVQYLIAFCSWPELTSDIISGKFVGPVVSDNPVKFSGSRLNFYQEILPEAVRGGIFDGFFSR